MFGECLVLGRLRGFGWLLICCMSWLVGFGRVFGCVCLRGFRLGGLIVVRLFQWLGLCVCYLVGMACGYGY